MVTTATSPAATGSTKSPWGWLPLILLLATSVNIYVTENPLMLDFSYLLPVLAGWLASRTGLRAAGPLSVAGVLAVFNFSWPLLDTPFDLRLSVYLSFSSHSFVTAMLAVIAFSQPTAGHLEFVQLKRRHVLWIALLAFSAAAAFAPTLKVWSSSVGDADFRPAAAVALLFLVPIVHWSRLLNHWRVGQNLIWKILIGALLILCAVSISVRPDGFEGHFSFLVGVLNPLSIAIAFCFMLTAFRLVDWRWLAGGMVSVLACAWVIASLIAPTNGNHPGMEANGVWDARFNFNRLGLLLVDGIAAALLGRLFAPFWMERQVAALKNSRTPIFLGAILVLLFFVGPLANRRTFFLDDPGLGVLGGTAFVMGLVWRGRGLTAPLIVQSLLLVSLASFGKDQSWVKDFMNWIGLGSLTFAFAFFGLLSNRYETSGQTQNVPDVSQSTLPHGAKA